MSEVREEDVRVAAEGYTERDVRWLAERIETTHSSVMSDGYLSVWQRTKEEIAEQALDALAGAGRLRTAGDDKAIRERDSLTRRLSVRFGELEEARAALRQMTDERDAARACAAKLAADFDRIADSTRQSLVSTPPEYAEEAVRHRARAEAFARSAEIAKGLTEHVPEPAVPVSDTEPRRHADGCLVGADCEHVEPPADVTVARTRRPDYAGAAEDAFRVVADHREHRPGCEADWSTCRCVEPAEPTPGEPR